MWIPEPANNFELFRFFTKRESKLTKSLRTRQLSILQCVRIQVPGVLKSFAEEPQITGG